MSGSEVGAFDTTGYRQRVLATLRSRSRLDLSDPFFVVDLPVDVDDDALIRARIAALVGFWNKERSPNYKALTAELARHRGDLEAVLLDPAVRAETAKKVRAARTVADADRYGALDALAEKLVARYQGIPRSRLPNLARLAKSKGLDDAAFGKWMAQRRIIEDGSGAQPLPLSVRAQIRADLDELGRLTGDSARSATLWTLLELSPAAAAEEIAAKHAELIADNERRQHDHQMTVMANVLTYVKQHLMTGEGTRYTASLLEDAKDRLRDSVTERVIVDGELTATDYEACVRRVIGYGFGLTSEQARTVVRQVATDLGATLAVAPAVDYVVCANCREPQPAGSGDACRYCGAELFLPCPACTQRVEAASVACPQCGVSLRAVRAAEEQLAAARAALGQGQPATARTQLVGVRRAARAIPALAAASDSLAQEIDRVLAAAQADWRAAERDVGEHRLYSAIDHLARVARVAADVAGPSGASASERLADLAARKASVQAEVAAARCLPDQAREAALGRVMRIAADCGEALDLLAAIPLAPPANLRTVVTDDAITLRWDRSPAPGPVSYRVVRIVSAPNGTHADSRPVGTTSSCEFEDAGAPGGALVAHEIAVVSGKRSSTALRSATALVVRDVKNLAAHVNGASVALSWTLPVKFGNVVVERVADPQAGLNLPLRRARADGHTWIDSNATPGVSFTYHVYAEYRNAGGTSVRTPGAHITAKVVPRPKPVSEIRAETASRRTTITWSSPPSGEVRIYAADAPLAAPDTDVDLAAVARRGRYVGAGQHSTVDEKAGGLVTYTPVTVDGSQAVAGPSVVHLPVPPPRNAHVTDTGTELAVKFSLPPGVTEALIVGRRDAMPSGPDDPDAETWKMTNTKLELNGGLLVPAPADGAAWYFSIHSLARDGSKALVAPTGVQLKARDAVAITAQYTVRRTGMRKKMILVEVTADGPLPPLVVRAKGGAIPSGMSDGTELGRLADGGTTARIEVPAAKVKLPAGIRVFSSGQVQGRPFTLTDPPESSLLLTG